jgi:hypothetical protein
MQPVADDGLVKVALRSVRERSLSLFCSGVDDEKSPGSDSDQGLGREKSVAQPKGGTGMQSGIVQRPGQPLDIHPGRSSMDCEHGDSRSRLTSDFEVGTGMNDSDERITHDSAKSKRLVPACSDHKGIAEQVIKTSAVAADDDGAIGARLERSVERELQVGGVLVDRMSTDLTSTQGPEHLGIDGIEVPDGDVDRQAERMGMMHP